MTPRCPTAPSYTAPTRWRCTPATGWSCRYVADKQHTHIHTAVTHHCWVHLAVRCFCVCLLRLWGSNLIPGWTLPPSGSWWCCSLFLSLVPAQKMDRNQMRSFTQMLCLSAFLVLFYFRGGHITGGNTCFLSKNTDLNVCFSSELLLLNCNNSDVIIISTRTTRSFCSTLSSSPHILDLGVTSFCHLKKQKLISTHQHHVWFNITYRFDVHM